MGYTYLLGVSDDCIRDKPEDWHREIGDAVVKICLDVAYYAKPDGTRRRDATVRNYGGCVRFCDEVHSTDTAVFVWGRNRLAPLRDATDDELTLIESLVSEERTRRSGAQAS